MYMKKMFKTFEISPVVENLNGTVEPFDSAQAAKKEAHKTGGRMFWSLYGKCEDGHSECIADRDDYEFTASLYQRVTGNPAPEVPGQYLQLPGVPAPEELVSRVASMWTLLNEVDQVLGRAEELFEEALEVHIYHKDDEIPEDCNYVMLVNRIREIRKQLN